MLYNLCATFRLYCLLFARKVKLMKKTKTKTDAKSLWIKIGVIAFVAIFVATLLFSVLRYSTGVMHRLTPAITVGDEKATAMDMRIFYELPLSVWFHTADVRL